MYLHSPRYPPRLKLSHTLIQHFPTLTHRIQVYFAGIKQLSSLRVPVVTLTASFPFVSPLILHNGLTNQSITSFETPQVQHGRFLDHHGHLNYIRMVLTTETFLHTT